MCFSLDPWDIFPLGHWLGPWPSITALVYGWRRLKLSCRFALGPTAGSKVSSATWKTQEGMSPSCLSAAGMTYLWPPLRGTVASLRAISGFFLWDWSQQPCSGDLERFSSLWDPSRSAGLISDNCWEGLKPSLLAVSDPQVELRSVGLSSMARVGVIFSGSQGEWFW